MRILSKTFGLLLALLIAVMGTSSAFAAAPSAVNEDRAKVDVVMLAAPNATVERNGVISYQLVATNRGDGPSNNVLISVPLDPAMVKLIDVTFSRPGAWVSRIDAGSLEIQTGKLSAGDDQLTATVRMQVLANVADGTALGQRASYSYSSAGSNSEGGSGRTNLPQLTVGQRSASSDVRTLVISPNALDRTVRFTSNNLFAPGEAVTLWYTNAAGVADTVDVKGSKVVPGISDNDDGDVGDTDTAYVIADSEGIISLEFETRDLDGGRYTLVARGNFSGLTAAAPFEAR